MKKKEDIITAIIRNEIYKQKLSNEEAKMVMEYLAENPDHKVYDHLQIDQTEEGGNLRCFGYVLDIKKDLWSNPLHPTYTASTSSICNDFPIWYGGKSYPLENIGLMTSSDIQKVISGLDEIYGVSREGNLGAAPETTDQETSDKPILEPSSGQIGMIAFGESILERSFRKYMLEKLEQDLSSAGREITMDDLGEILEQSIGRIGRYETKNFSYEVEISAPTTSLNQSADRLKSSVFVQGIEFKLIPPYGIEPTYVHLYGDEISNLCKQYLTIDDPAIDDPNDLDDLDQNMFEDSDVVKEVSPWDAAEYVNELTGSTNAADVFIKMERSGGRGWDPVVYAIHPLNVPAQIETAKIDRDNRAIKIPFDQKTRDALDLFNARIKERKTQDRSFVDPFALFMVMNEAIGPYSAPTRGEDGVLSLEQQFYQDEAVAWYNDVIRALCDNDVPLAMHLMLHPQQNLTGIKCIPDPFADKLPDDQLRVFYDGASISIMYFMEPDMLQGIPVGTIDKSGAITVHEQNLKICQLLQDRGFVNRENGENELCFRSDEDRVIKIGFIDYNGNIVINAAPEVLTAEMETIDEEIEETKEKSDQEQDQEQA